MPSSAATSASSRRWTASSASKLRAASPMSRSSSGRSPSRSVSDSLAGSSPSASLGRRSVSSRLSSCSKRSAPSPNSARSTAARCSRDLSVTASWPSRAVSSARVSGRSSGPMSEKSTPTRPATTKNQVLTFSLCFWARRPIADRDGVGDHARAGVAAGELHPRVAVRGVLPAPEQVRLHRARLGRERVEAAGVDPAVQHERIDQFEHFGLAGAVVTAQHRGARRRSRIPRRRSPRC